MQAFLEPKYITDENGQEMAVIPRIQYEAFISKINLIIEELEDIRDLDKLIADDDGLRYTIDEVFGDKEN
ncbi:MAG: hypothetical protein Kapaf2KO_03830 [Candidatus Kapaibacteriales bacterium]